MHTQLPEWLALLDRVQDVRPAHSTIIVLADRGLYTRWLCRRRVRLGWHPFQRVNHGGAASGPPAMGTCP